MRSSRARILSDSNVASAQPDEAVFVQLNEALASFTPRVHRRFQRDHVLLPGGFDAHGFKRYVCQASSTSGERGDLTEVLKISCNLTHQPEHVVEERGGGSPTES